MFYVIEATETTSGTAKAITEKDNIDEAFMLHWQVLASAVANVNASACLCMIVNTDGNPIRKEHWVRQA